MRNHVVLALCCLLIAGCGKPQPSAPQPPANTPSPPRPNVVWILVDTLRAKNLSGYGYERPTSPNMDAMAKSGVLFEQHFSQGNETIVSVPSYMTGRYFPVFSQSVGSWKQLAKLPPGDEKMLPEILRTNGYHTAAFSAHPFYQRGSRLFQAFDEYHFVRGARAGRNAHFGEVLKPVIDWIGQPHDKPFMLYVHVMDVHFPHYVMKGFEQWLDLKHPRAVALQDSGTPPYDEKDREFLRGLYDNSILFTDKMVGTLVQALQVTKLMDNTIVLVSSDHGELLAEDGQTVGHPNTATVDEVYHVPLIMMGPGLPQGKRVGSLTENADIVPTLLELLGVKTDAAIDGRSLVPATRDAGTPHEFTFGKAEGLNAGMPAFVLRNPALKWVYSEAAQQRQVWQAPDSAAGRKPGNAAAGQAAFPEAAIAKLAAGWRAYDALPYGPVTAFTEIFPKPEPGQEAAYLIDVEDWNDSKWTCRASEVASCAWREDAPPLTFRIPVPRGRYRVEIELVTGEREGHAASAMLVKAKGETAFRRVVSQVEQEGYELYRLVPLGTYDVSDGIFDITLDDDREGYWSVAHALRFVPEGVTALTPEEQTQSEEQLRAIGYLGGKASK